MSFCGNSILLGGRLIRGTIIKGVGGLYAISTDNGRVDCTARGKFRNEQITPLVGDYVEINVEDAVINSILPRRNELLRPRVANVDQAVFVCSMEPKINYDSLDKFLLHAAAIDIPTIIAVNKCDLDDGELAISLKDIYNGYTVLQTSINRQQSISDLKHLLTNKITVFAGASGVGKSSILNTISDSQVMLTGDISDKIKRGKHTTRHSELIEFYKNSFIIDTPGFSLITLSNITKAQLAHYFIEFLPFLNDCTYVGCSHIKEDGCAVKSQVGIAISEQRYARYVLLHDGLPKN